MNVAELAQTEPIRFRGVDIAVNLHFPVLSYYFEGLSDLGGNESYLNLILINE